MRQTCHLPTEVKIQLRGFAHAMRKHHTVADDALTSLENRFCSAKKSIGMFSQRLAIGDSLLFEYFVFVFLSVSVFAPSDRSRCSVADQRQTTIQRYGGPDLRTMHFLELLFRDVPWSDRVTPRRASLPDITWPNAREEIQSISYTMFLCEKLPPWKEFLLGLGTSSMLYVDASAKADGYNVRCWNSRETSSTIHVTWCDKFHNLSVTFTSIESIHLVGI